MPGKHGRRQMKRQREPMGPPPPVAAPVEDDEEAEAADGVEEDEEDGEHTDTASLQELSFDVTAVQPDDLYSLMDLLDRHLPFDLHPDACEGLAAAVQRAEHASVAKVADDDDQANVVFGATALLPLQDQGRVDGLAHIVRAVAAADGSSYFAEALGGGGGGAPVAWLLTDRLPSLPLELGVAMLEDIFREYREAKRARGRRYELFFCLLRVDNRPPADDDDEEEDEEDAPRARGKRRAARGDRRTARPAANAPLTAATLEDRHFAKPEEWFLWTHRVREAPFVLLRHTVKRSDVAAEPPVGTPLEVFSVPVVVHRSRVNRLLADLKGLDAYYASAENVVQDYEED